MSLTKKLLFALAFLVAPAVSSAATLILSANPVAIGKGDTVEVTLTVDSDASVNTFSSTLLYPTDILVPIAINDGSSIVSVWLTRPSVTDGVPFTFAGFTPGGFSGRNGKLFSIVFKAMSAGSVKISLTDVAVLRNDGVGTKEVTVAQPLSLVIAQKATGGFTEPADTFPPEPFSVYLGEDTQLFNGEKYLVFTTVDKGSGMDFYEVAEKRFPFIPLAWQKTDSPYRMSNQYLTSDVYLKAVDRVGNERVIVFHRQHMLRSYEWGIFGMLIVLVAFWYWRRTRTL